MRTKTLLDHDSHVVESAIANGSDRYDRMLLQIDRALAELDAAERDDHNWIRAMVGEFGEGGL